MCGHGICSFCRLKRSLSRKSSSLAARIEAELRKEEEGPSPEERLEKYLELKRRGML